jgi:hypothetical protein
MFYVLVFGILAVVLIFAGVAGASRRRRSMEHEEAHVTHNDASRRTRKAKRAQSQHDRRKRH